MKSKLQAQTKEEYKETELGLLPKYWDVQVFTKCIEKVEAPKKIKFYQPEYLEYGRYAIVHQGQELIAGYHNDEKRLYAGDLPIIIFGDVSRIFKFIDFPFSLGADGSKIIIPKRNLLDTKYFFFYLKTLDIPSRGYNRHYKDLKEKKIVIPPLPEQQKIAYVLSTVQLAKEKTDGLIKSLKELKKAMIKHLFTYSAVSFEDEDKVELKDTEIGKMPKNWEVVKLGDVCSYKTGKLNSEAGKKLGAYPFFTCSQETFKIDTYSFDQEALLLAGNNAQGKYSIKHYKGKFDVYQRTYVLTIKDTKKADYTYLLYEIQRKLETLRNQSLGSTTKYLTAGIITSLNLVLPKISEQQQIALILSSIDTKIEAEEQSKEAIEQLFKSLLHNLMSAKIRVTDLKIEGTNG